MKIPPLVIGDIHVPFPLIQGGMGVRVSLARLAAAVANEGGIGTIAAVGLGDIEASKTDFENVSSQALANEIRRAKSMTDGPIAINILGVLSNARELIQTSVREGIKLIVSGASLPLKLPEMVGDATVNLLPIISSGRAADLVLRAWDKRYARTADAVILEGPLAGGHLGFSFEQLREPEKYSLAVLLPEVLAVIKPFETKYGRKIPVIVGGGIFTGTDIARMLQAGASGVQMATRFVCTDECEVSQEFKQAYLDSKEDDIVIIDSPVGLPGRAIHNQFLRNLENDALPRLKCPYQCLTTCNIAKARYCIALALINAYQGDMDKGLVFCGQNAYRVNEIVSVKKLIAELREEIEAYPAD
ncbi:MAG: nitronate monooxygenase family protein [Candidatus Aminicenantes bacterium]|nr:nitronate monooxygenase family protein [Candidatus Aminicenantes bacterium]